MIHHLFTRRQIASVMLASYLMGPALVFAQVIINGGTPNDGRRAYVDQTQNGLPKVNIATPNGAGVSHNMYQEFNVGKQGLILNNGANNSNTSLAGWVEGNPNLTAGNEAKMILNEVVGAKPSQLQGFLEVAGKKADVILTNENGVTCNGCGFINTSRVTLSTGAPMWGNGGQLDGLKVRQGSLVIGGEGLSAPDARVDLLSQAINIQGDIHADKINVIAGGNDIRYHDLSLAKQADIKGTLDIAALGGMYANQIQLVATGTGVGVHVDGTLISAGNVSITSDGKLTHTGKTSAQNNIQINAQQITQSGSVLATENLDIQAQSLTNTGTLVGQDLSLQVDQALVNQGSVGANAALTVASNSLDNSGKLSAKGSAQITTGTFSNSGDVMSDASLNVDASSIDNTAQIAGNSVMLTSAGTLDNRSTASIAAATTFTLKSNAINNAGSLSANQSITLEADTLVQSGNLVSKGTFTASKLSTLENSGVLNGQTLDVTAGKVLNLGTGTVASSGETVIHATTLNNLGRIHTEGKATFDTRRVNNAGVMQTTGGLDVNQAWTVQNSGTLSGSNVAVNTQALNNSGRIQAEQLTLSSYQDSNIPTTDKLAQTSVTNSGLMVASQMTITGFGGVSNTNQMSTDIAASNSASPSADSGNLRIQADTLDNTGGSVLAKNKLVVDAGNVYNNRATLSSKGDLDLTVSGNIDNGEGLILHQGSGTAKVQAGLALNNAKGQIEGQGQSLSVSAGDIDNTQGQIIQTQASSGAQPATLTVTAQAAAGAASTTGQLINIKGKISSTGNGTVTADSLVTDASSAQLSGGSSLKFLDKSKAGSGANTSTSGYDWNADIAAANAVAQAQAAADKANADAQTAAANLKTAQDNLAKVQADKTSTKAAIDQASANVTAAQTANDAAQAAAIDAAQKLADAKAAVPTITDGTTGTGSAPTNDKPDDLSAPVPPTITLNTPTSQIQAANDLTLSIGAGLLDNRQGSLAAGHNLIVNAQGDVLAGQMAAGNALSVTAKQLEVDQQIRGKTADITADKLIVTGRVQGDDSLTIKADNITNSGTLTGGATQLQGRSSDSALELGNTGMVQGNQSLSITANKVLNQATLASGGDITTQTQYLENQALIYSGGHQKHYGVELVNNGGRIYAVGDITIQGNAAGDNADSLLNYVGRIEAQGDINIKANTITNRAVVPTVNTRGVVVKTITPTLITTSAKDTFNADGKTAEILAGKNLNVTADTLNNEYGIISARLNANIGTRLLTNRAYGAIQTQNYVVKAACFNCHQTVSYSETWGGVIAAGGTATVTANEKLDNKTIDTRDGFAGLSTDPRVVIVDERSNTASPLTQAFKDRFGIVNGPANSASGTAPSLDLGSPKALSDGIVLNPNGTFDFSHYTVPNGQTGLFEKAPATSPYLIRGRSDLYSPATNGQYTSYDKFAGSDYLLKRLGLMPSGIKLLGDAWYETQLVQDQMYALKGRTHLVAGTDNDYDLMMGLMDAGLLAQAQFGFGLGDALSPAQQAALTQDMVWPEWQVVDGQKVLVPKLYVAHQETNNDNNKGARIVGTNVAITTRELENTGTLEASNSLAINAAGKVSGGGSYSGGKTLAIVADTVDLKHASIQSSGWLSIDTAKDLTLTATQIKADGDARLSAGGTIALNADKHEAHVVRGNGSSKDEVRYETSNVSAAGNLTIEGVRGVVAQGSKLDAGEDFKLSSKQGNVDLQAVVDSENVNIKGARGGGFLGGLLSRLTGNTTQAQDIKGVQINAGSNAVVQATQGDVSAQSLQLHAGEQAAVVAGGAVKLTSEQAYSKVQNGNDVRQSLVTERSEIAGDKGVTIYGQNSVQLDAASVKATQGDVTVSSAGNVSMGFNTDTQQHNWTTSSTSGNPIKSKTTTTQHETLDKTAQVTELEGQNVKVLGYNVKSEGAKMDGSQLVQVEGVNNTQLYAVQEEHKTTTSSQTSSSLIGITYSKSSSTDTTLKSEALGTKLSSDEAVQIGVGAVTDVQGAILTAPKVDFVRSAGADTSQDGELKLAGSTNTTETSHTEKTTTAGVWQAQSGHGETSQTYNQTQINGQVNIATGIRTTVVIPEGDLKKQVLTLSQQPGQAYIAELAKDPRINWQQVKLAYDKWDYSAQGLTPAGAALLAIAVAVASGGSAASFVNSMGFSGPMAASMTAGLTSLASSAAVSFVNNGGDLGKTLHDMGSSQNIKGIALAMVSAGVLSELNSTMGLDKVKVTDGFTANLNKAIINNLANATMTSAITGTPLEDNIKTGLVSAFISAGAGSAAFEIGEKTANDQMAKALAHAIAGCVAGAAGQGSGGCSAGATGAVVGELAAQWYDPNGTKKPEDTLNFVKVVTAAAAAITGNGSAASVSTAVMTGVNAAQNNYLNHTQWKQLADKLKTCTPGPDCDAAVKEYAALSGKQDKELADACRDINSPLCRVKISESQVGTLTQKDLVASGALPANYLGGADFNANANRYAKTAFLTDLKAECARNASCDAKKTAALTKLGSTVLDFVPVIGDIKAYVEAETPFDYLLATVGIAGPVGDGVAKALREGKALYKAGDVAGATAKLDEAKTIVVDSKGNALIGDWSYTKTLTSPENAQAHWTKHASEFPQYSNAAQYVEGAQAFVANPPASALKIVRSNGDTVLFDPLTDTFAIKSVSGGPRTMFKPDPANHGYPTNLDYFNAQK
jgi:filamentous hemagglutinin family protein